MNTTPLSFYIGFVSGFVAGLFFAVLHRWDVPQVQPDVVRCDGGEGMTPPPPDDEEWINEIEAQIRQTGA